MNLRIITFAASFLAAAIILVPSVLAQNGDDVRIRAKQVIIEVDEDGRVLVDGKHLSEEDGAVILRVEPDDDAVEVEAVGPRRMAFRGAPHRDHERVFFRRFADGLEHHVDDLDFKFEMPDLPEMGAMMKRFRVDVGDPLRESIEEHREVAELERESRDLARKARRADGADRQALETELRAQLGEIFAKKVGVRERRIADLEEKLADEREKLNRRRAARDEMIERRLRSLMGEDDILDW